MNAKKCIIHDANTSGRKPTYLYHGLSVRARCSESDHYSQLSEVRLINANEQKNHRNLP